MTHEDTKQKLKEIARWLEARFNQDSEDYSIFEGSKPMVLRYDDEIKDIVEKYRETTK